MNPGWLRTTVEGTVDSDPKRRAPCLYKSVFFESRPGGAQGRENHKSQFGVCRRYLQTLSAPPDGGFIQSHDDQTLVAERLTITLLAERPTIRHVVNVCCTSM